jgi:hypothetical protein
MNLRRKPQPADIYTRVKMHASPIEKPIRKYIKGKKICILLKFFKKYLQSELIAKLKTTGSGFVSGKITIPDEIVTFLKSNFSV